MTYLKVSKDSTTDKSKSSVLFTCRPLITNNLHKNMPILLKLRPGPLSKTVSLPSKLVLFLLSTVVCMYISIYSILMFLYFSYWVTSILLARLQTWRAIIFSQVCLSVCLWPALLPFNINRFWRNLVTRTLLWSSLAATIMAQIVRRGTARRLFENFKKISKITNSNFKILVHHFFASGSPVYCKKIRLNSNKTDGGDRFWSLPLWRFRQWHCCSCTTLGTIFWLNRRCGGVQRSKLGGILN